MTIEQRLTKAPEETRERFIARIVATARPPSDGAVEQLRRLLPPPKSREHPVALRRGAA